MNLIKDFITGLHWWYSGWDSACQCRRHGLGSPIWEDSTCRRQLKSMRHNYWGRSVKPSNHNYWAPGLQLQKPECPRVCPPGEETPALQQRAVPLTTMGESLNTERKTQHSHKKEHSVEWYLITTASLALDVEKVLNVPRSNALTGQWQKRREGNSSWVPGYSLHPGHLCVTVMISLDARAAIHRYHQDVFQLK